MDKFNVMPPVNPASGQPMHKPSVTTPIPPTPEIPSMTPQTPNHGSKVAGKLKYLLILPVLLVLGAIVFGYLVIVKGQTSYGQNLQDEVWASVVNSTNSETKDLDFSITYTDKGSYLFKPSNFLKPFNIGATESEYEEIDSIYAFTIKDPSVTGSLSSYIDLSNTEIPKTDSELKGSVSNNGKSFEGSLSLKLKETEAYAKYDYNTNVEDLTKYLGFYSDPGSEKNQWIQTTNESDIKDMREFVQYITLLKDFASSSSDAKRVADIRQIASALELYFNDNNEYPDSNNGKPVGLDSYIGTLPTAPPADGNCSDDLNEYDYTAKTDNSGSNTNYSLTFCLGSSVGGLEAGNQESTALGITPYNCPSNRTCVGEKRSEEEKSKYQKLLSENRLLNIKTLKGVSMIDSTPVLHYELELNKEKLKTIIETSINDLFKEPYDQELRSFSLEIANILIEKINIQNYEVWVGVTDKKLYKSVATIDALSITKAAQYFETSLNDPTNPITNGLKEQTEVSQAKSRDAQRIADVRQMASAFELYYNDFGEYPASENGQPLNLVPTYLLQIPAAPLPTDGDCDEYYNTYWYIRTSPNSYTLTFCLGEMTGGIAPGINTATEMGIQSSRPFDNSSEEEYYNESNSFFESFKSTVINTIKDLQFDAELKIEYMAKGFGETKEIQSPSDFVNKK